jgi:hypothetical protein
MNNVSRVDASWRRNTIVGGLEISVAHRPGGDLDQALEQSGWRWSRSIESWFHPDTPDAVEFAQEFCARVRSARPR